MTLSLFSDLVRQIVELRSMLNLPLIVGFRREIPGAFTPGSVRITKRILSCFLTNEKVVLLQLRRYKDFRELFCDYIVRRGGTSLKERGPKDPIWNCIAAMNRS